MIGALAARNNLRVKNARSCLGQGHKNQGFVKRHQLTSNLIQAILHGLECRKFCLIRLWFLRRKGKARSDYWKVSTSASMKVPWRFRLPACSLTSCFVIVALVPYLSIYLALSLLNNTRSLPSFCFVLFFKQNIWPNQTNAFAFFW